MLLRQNALEPIGMGRGNMERMYEQNRNWQNGEQPSLGIPLQMLSHLPSGTGFYRSGMRDFQRESARSDVYAENRNDEANQEKSATGNSPTARGRINAFRHFSAKLQNHYTPSTDFVL